MAMSMQRMLVLAAVAGVCPLAVIAMTPPTNLVATVALQNAVISLQLAQDGLCADLGHSVAKRLRAGKIHAVTNARYISKVVFSTGETFFGPKAYNEALLTGLLAHTEYHHTHPDATHRDAQRVEKECGALAGGGGR